MSSLSEQNKKDKGTTFSDKKLQDYGESWNSVTHAIAIIGWGVDEKKNEKYWIIRNSYGKDWGEKGDFKVRKGENDFALEVEASAFDPILCSEGGC